MELKEWLQDWDFQNNPFVIFDADRDPFLQDAMLENTSLRSLLQLEKPSPFVIFAIRGAGKSSMRIDAERFLAQFRDKVMVLRYVEFNELLSEKTKSKTISPDYVLGRGFLSRLFRRKRAEIVPPDRKITLDDHLDYILRLGIEELYRYLMDHNKENILKASQEYGSKFLLLTALYFAPTDFSRKMLTIRNLLKITGRKKSGMLKNTKRDVKQLAVEIFRGVRGIPISLENTAQIIKEIGTALFTSHAIPTNTENRFTLLKYFMELVRYFGLSGVYLLVDRVDEPTSIKGDPEKMRELVTPLLDDQLFQIDHLGIVLFLPFELHDLKKYYRSDRIKTVPSINWSAENMIRLIEKRMNICRTLGAEPVRLRDLFEEDGESKAQFIVRQLTPRNAFRLLGIIIEQHCETVDRAKRISTEVYESAVHRYLIEKEGY